MLFRSRLLSSLPDDSGNPASTKHAALAAGGLKYITAFKALKRLSKRGLVACRKVRGDMFWHRVSRPAIDEEGVRRLFTLKNLVESGVALLSVKRIEKAKPATGMVYDIELSPTHSFVCGVGGLLVSNTDADPYGWYIYSTMKYGSMALAHESDRLGTQEMKFLGMSISDIEHYDMRSVTIKAKDVDRKSVV